MKSAWKGLAVYWGMLLPPNRPSKGDLEIYGRFFNKKLKPKVNILLLGCTPEIRDILHAACLSYQANLIMVDVLPDMFKAMSTKTEADNKKEKFVKADWANTGLSSKSFDLIIGDEVICNLPMDYRDAFYKEMVRLLKSDGWFVTKHDAIEKGKKPDIKVIKNELEKTIHMEQTIGQAGNTISEYVGLHKAGTHPEGLYTIEQTIGAMAESLEKFKGDKKIYPICKEIYRRIEPVANIARKHTWVYHNLKENEEELKKYFKIIDKAQPSDYLTAYLKTIYVLQPKASKK